MRIAYIVELDAFENTGVLKKITSQISMWKKNGAEAKLFLISKPPGKKRAIASCLEDTEVNIYYSSLLNNLYKWTGKKRAYINKILTSLSVLKDVRNYSPDILYYRFGIWFPGQLARFKKIPLIVELNSNDIEEAKLYNNLSQTIHFNTRRKLLNRADGFCSVTHEIEKDLVPKHAQSITIANGIDLSAIELKRKKKNIRMQIVFVGNSDCPWHGVEKIVYLARELPQFDFHVVGPDLNNYNDLTSNILFHGFLDSANLSQMYNMMDIAIGTLSLHKKNMTEASALKVRESVAHGLPTIIGYYDTDLNGKNYILNIGNYENNVKDNLHQITDFIELWGGKSIKSNFDCIDMFNKEKKRLNFFKLFIK